MKGLHISRSSCWEKYGRVVREGATLERLEFLPASKFSIAMLATRRRTWRRKTEHVSNCVTCGRHISYSDGGCYLLLGLLVGCAVTISACAQTNYQRLLSFGPSPMQGSAPRGQLVEASDGFLYGTTYQGGSNNSGTVFRVSKSGSGFSRLCQFTNVMFPTAGVSEGPDGALYGTTSGGGTNGAGALFKIPKTGVGLTVLHHFNSFVGDGNTPLAGVTVGADGSLYGTTAGGGLSNDGCIFKLNPDGSGYTIIHSFSGTDGVSPVGGVILGKGGALYGTTKTGGSNNLGTVFTIDLSGSNYSVLHHFSGKDSNDGSLPLGALVEAGAGFLYGTTYNGGNSGDLGTIFRVNTNSTGYAVLHAFQGGTADGALPVVGLSLAAGSGMLYGTAPHGGASDGGILFGLSFDGISYFVLHYFNSGAGDGTLPFVAPVVGSDGALYGSTYFGGAYVTNGVSGTLFKLFSGSPQITVTSIASSPAGIALRFAGGAAGQTCRVQAASGFGIGGWQVIGTNSVSLDGTFSFLDATASNYQARVYRSVSP